MPTYISNSVLFILKGTETRKERFMSINYKKIGLKIKEYRLKNNLTQEEFAEMCDLSTIHISNIERGKACLSLFTLKKMSDILEFEITLDISDRKKDVIENILENCCHYEYKILRDVLIATKKSLDLNLKFKS